jgi:SAM-dependent methyltransferase
MMADPAIIFNDGESYDRSMGVWSLLVGEQFLDWLGPPDGLRWLDVGCGSGAFTELVIQRCAPSEAQGIDPSEGQLAFARTRPAARIATFRQGDAMALPFDDDCFDAAVMALVLFFVPEPAKGVAEMARVVRPGGIVAAYLWDLANGGFPFEPIRQELRGMGYTPPNPPSAQASRADVLRGLWEGAGFTDIEARSFTISRTFASFEEFWTITSSGSGIRTLLDGMTPSDVDRLKSLVRVRLPADAAGRVTYQSTANAIQGRLPV